MWEGRSVAPTSVWGESARRSAPPTLLQMKERAARRTPAGEEWVSRRGAEVAEGGAGRAVSAHGA
jgi:hypothetical protein